MRALIAQGVTAPALYRLLKRLYVEVAEREFRLDGERPTDSRISLLTGVHRRDVKAFRRAGCLAASPIRLGIDAAAWDANNGTIVQHPIRVRDTGNGRER